MVDYVVAALAAYTVTIFDLWSVGYRKTFDFLVQCRPAHFLALVYALAALALVAFFDNLVVPSIEGAPGNEGIGPAIQFMKDNPFWKGAIVGALTNGLVNIRFFSIPSGVPGQEPFPVGLRTLTQIFDAPLRDDVSDHHYFKVKSYCERHMASMTAAKDLDSLQEMARTAIPQHYVADRRAVVLADFAEATTPVDLLRKFTQTFGQRRLRDTFR